MNGRIFNFIFLEPRHIDAENRKELGNAHAVDSAQAEKLMNAGNGVCILQPGKPIVGNKEFRIALRLSNALTLILDLTHGYA